MGQARVIRHSCRVKIDEGDPRAGSTQCTLEYTLLHFCTVSLEYECSSEHSLLRVEMQMYSSTREAKIDHCNVGSSEPLTHN